MAGSSFSDGSVSRFREEVRSWLRANVDRHRVDFRWEEQQQIEVRREWEKALDGAHLNCLAWPVEYGGRGYGPVEEFVFAEECIAADAPEPLGRIGRILVAPGLFVHGTPQQQDRFLPAILHCSETWCQGFSEPGAGSDLANLRTRAKRDGDRYIVDGQKIWTSFGHYADQCLLLARTGEPGGRHRGLTMFALPMKQPGVQLRPIRQINGQADFNEVFFDAAEVPAECRIGEEGEGWKVAMTVLTAERGAGFAALKIKKMRDLVELLELSLAGRESLEPGLHSAKTRFEVAQWHIRRSIELLGSSRNPLPASSILKLLWSELEQDMARLGFESDNPAFLDQWRHHLLSLRADTIASGTSEIQRNVIAERVLGLPR